MSVLSKLAAALPKAAKDPDWTPDRATRRRIERWERRERDRHNPRRQQMRSAFRGIISRPDADILFEAGQARDA